MLLAKFFSLLKIKTKHPGRRLQIHQRQKNKLAQNIKYKIILGIGNEKVETKNVQKDRIIAGEYKIILGLNHIVVLDAYCIFFFLALVLYKRKISY